jgi:endonuclease YncB( thermonuclease family)
MYEYELIEFLGAVDGDTVSCRIALGFGLSATFRFRLAGIDTAELRDPDPTQRERAQAARSATASWFEQTRAMGHRIVVRTEKGAASTIGIGDGAFGRWLATFVDAVTGESLQEWLTAHGHA